MGCKMVNELGAGSSIDVFVFTLCDFEAFHEVEYFRGGISITKNFILKNAL